MTDDSQIRIHDIDLLSDHWGRLNKVSFDYRRSDGSWQRQVREVYDRGNGAVILLYSPEQGTVVLTRQFRLPAYMTGHKEPLIEACAGLLDARDPETAIRHEAEEETGFQVGAVQKLWEVYMSPGSVTETLHFFIAPYDSSMKRSAGGGLVEEGEDIEVIELPLQDALAMIADGAIRDAKTIMLLQHVALMGLCGPR